MRAEPPRVVAAASAPSAVPVAVPVPEPPSVQEIGVPRDLPVFAVHGATQHRFTGVFLAGLCSEPQWYVASFEHAAADRGDLLGLQGDVPCTRQGSRWSYDIPKTSARIGHALSAAEYPDPGTMLLIGYSQGAEQVEYLAEHFPDRYTRVILIASPITPSPKRLRRADAVVTMAGSRDLQANMKEGTRLLKQAGVPSEFFVLPGATHGQMGDDPDGVMGAALEWALAQPSRK